MTKVCKTCKQEKNVSEFYTYKNRLKKIRPHCIPCYSNNRDKQDWQQWRKGWPYKGDIKDANYLADRKALFDYHGNGWWWGNNDKEA